MSLYIKRAVGLVIAAVIVILMYVVFGNVKKAINMPVNNKVIVIDAGHGGRDAGASGKAGISEKEINLEISKKLKRYIEENGGVAIMIREDDTGLYSIDSKNKKREDMKNRKQIIKESGANLLVSIHLNSFPQSKYYGAQVFYFKGSAESQRFATIVQQELRRILNRNNDRVEKSTETYFILKDNDIPSILIECGFLSNPEEESLLATPVYQEKIAWSIYTGIMRYLTEPITIKSPNQ